MNNEELQRIIQNYSHAELLRIIYDVYWFDLNFCNALSGLSLERLRELVFDIVKFKDKK